MPEQLESLIPEPERREQDIAEEITQTLRGAFDTLVRRRDAAYAAAIAPLDEERGSLTRDHAAIEEAARNLAELLPAKARVAQAEHDRLLLAGDREGAAAKLAEQKDAEAAPAMLGQRQQEIFNRIEAVGEEKRRIARNIFEAWYAQCQDVVRAAEHGLFITLLDGLKQSFFDFEQRTDTTAKSVSERGLFTSGNLTDLTAPERSPEWVSSQAWYRGRSR